MIDTTWTLIAGIFIAAAGCCDAWLSSRAGSWPTVEGEIIDSDLEQLSETNSKLTDTYAVSVHYRYSVKGREFIGERIAYGLGVLLMEQSAQRIVDRYPVGERVRIYVCPTNPAQSVLEVRVTWAAIALILLGIVVVVWSALK